ncbi:unnamed protein product [Phaedon cochleariae]|uniref:Uncharacterized protein n=1 Tax=Phaedon cochleariae TaxID=80249 RepID=A0A9N9SJ45_PHACE|nr:unnamed protein product [Phaedon cochleariae]
MLNLKYIFVLSLFIGDIFSQENPGSHLNTVIRFHRECQSQTGVSDAVVFGIISGKFPSDPAFRRHILCMNQKMGFQDNNGNINRNLISSTLRTAMPNGNIEGMVQNCAVQRADPEETAFEMDQCFFRIFRSKMG